MNDRLLEAKEVAKLLAVPESWVRQHTRAKTIPHVQLGRWVRYDADDVAAWVESLKAGGGPGFRKYQPQGRSKAAEGGAL